MNELNVYHDDDDAIQSWFEMVEIYTLNKIGDKKDECNVP